jgi:hypothetical protein
MTADQPVNTAGDHKLVAAVAEPAGGYRVECSCGWLSGVVKDPTTLLEQWEEHRGEV